jgi:site-specific recombinase XerD
MTATSQRLLAREHFAFARALTQGLDESTSWNQYLQVEGEHTDARIVRRTIGWIREAFAAVARRERRPGMARLVRIDPVRLRAVGARGAAALPTLEDFAYLRGLEDYSEGEQLSAFLDAFPQARRGLKQAKLIDKQLAAISWLETLAAQDPGPGDAVGAWLAPALAERLEGFGLHTLFLLAERVNGLGRGWFRPIPAIGASKAARIVAWLRKHQDTIGVPIGAHVARTHTEAKSSGALAAVVVRDTALLPLEKFRVPTILDGSAGLFRAPQAQCMLEAGNDYAAILAWLASKRGPGATENDALNSTQRSYRREAERLLLWSILERRKALSSLNVEDAQAFMAFLAAPPAHWCNPKGLHPHRWSSLWRPCDGPLAPSSLAQAQVILKALYGWLMTQHYLVGNPFAALPAKRAGTGRRLGAGRSLSASQWAFVLERLEMQASTVGHARLRFALPWLYATALRRSEMAAATCGDLETFEYHDDDGTPVSGWMQVVRGKGGKVREVPVPEGLIRALKQILREAGRPDDPAHPENRAVPLLFRRQVNPEGETALVAITDFQLHKDVKRFLHGCSQALAVTDPAGAARLEAASTHWLRHTSATHQVNGAPGRPAVPLHIAQQVLGHASPATTSGYVQAERDAKARAMRGFWRQ